jgi:hypothetical protein
VRKKTQPSKKLKVCVYCKRPIKQSERPAIVSENGDEMHVECYSTQRMASQEKDKK